MTSGRHGPCHNAKHCGHTSSPGEGPTCNWHLRNSPTGSSLTLCNSCKINWDQGKYCPYCSQLYRDRDPDGFDGKEWVGCDTTSCRRWVHISCEKEKGFHVATDELYLCPNCRKEKESAKMDVRKRSTRTVPARNGAANGGASGNSSEDEDEQHGTTPPMQRTSARRQPRVDLSRLETSSLRKYRRVYKLGDMNAGSREELMPAVVRHFTQQVVEEDETLLSFAYTLRKQVSGQGTSPAAGARGSSGPQGIKKPGPKPKPFAKGAK
mmetsp:Transcript_57311/g.181392  ORF Transcript_57311/g.181392 Transcript_57311/m.181392 type:complete len:266 (+) Transcript_57311:988-1785(+)